MLAESSAVGLTTAASFVAEALELQLHNLEEAAAAMTAD